MLVALLLPLDVVSISRCRVKWGRKNSSRDKRVADRGGLGLAEPSVDSSTADAARNDRRTHVAGDHPNAAGRRSAPAHVRVAHDARIRARGPGLRRRLPHALADAVARPGDSRDISFEGRNRQQRCTASASGVAGSVTHMAAVRRTRDEHLSGQHRPRWVSTVQPFFR